MMTVVNAWLAHPLREILVCSASLKQRTMTTTMLALETDHYADLLPKPHP